MCRLLFYCDPTGYLIDVVQGRLKWWVWVRLDSDIYRPTVNISLVCRFSMYRHVLNTVLRLQFADITQDDAFRQGWFAQYMNYATVGQRITA